MNRHQQSRERANSVSTIKEVVKRKREEENSKEEQEILAEISQRNEKTARTPEKEKLQNAEQDKEMKEMEALLKSTKEMRNEMKAMREETQEGFRDNKEEIRMLKAEMEKKEENWKKEKKALEGRIEALEKGQEMQEKLQRKNNIIIKGVTLNEGQEKQGVEEFIQKELKINVTVDRVQIIKRESGGSEMVKVGLKSWGDKIQIMRNKSKLKENSQGRAWFIDNDLTRQEEKIQKEIRERAREEKKKGE